MLTTERSDTLNRLAWLAKIDPAINSVIAKCGSDVEINDRFIVEGVWDGDFGMGDFDRSNHFFGSGLKITDEGVIVAPSTALVDRVLICEIENIFYVSNSLIFLMAFINADLDKNNNYKEQASTILKGVDQYDPQFPIKHPKTNALFQFFYHPVLINKNGIHQISRSKSPFFSDFLSYRKKLLEDLNRIKSNAKDTARSKPLKSYTTVSRGYDSTAVTALTHESGLVCAFTKKRSSSSMLAALYPKASNDDGSRVSNHFSIKTEYLDIADSDIDEDELYYLSPSSAEPEIAFFKIGKSLEKNNEPSLVYTGYHGDKVWDKNLFPKYLTKDIRRGDTSGLNLSEIRLKSGFINVAIPFMYSDAIESIHQISNAPDMTQWSIGGNYDRPIPRRIAEDLGVPRDYFGMRKKAVIDFYHLPKNRKLRKSFLRHIKSRYKITWKDVFLGHSFDRTKYSFLRIFFILSQSSSLTRGKVKNPLTSNKLDLPYKMHIWALNQQIKTIKESLDFKL